MDGSLSTAIFAAAVCYFTHSLDVAVMEMPIRPPPISGLNACIFPNNKIPVAIPQSDEVGRSHVSGFLIDAPRRLGLGVQYCISSIGVQS